MGKLTLEQLVDVRNKLAKTYLEIYPPAPTVKWWNPMTWPHWSDGFEPFDQFRMRSQIQDLDAGIKAMRNGLNPGYEATIVYKEYS